MSFMTITCPSGVSAGHIIPQCELCNCRGFANLPGYNGMSTLPKPNSRIKGRKFAAFSNIVYREYLTFTSNGRVQPSQVGESRCIR